MLVETNWVVDYVAPGHFRDPSAVALIERAGRGEIELFIPSVSLIEARKVILERGRFQVREEVAGVREFLKSRLASGDLSDDLRSRMDAVLSQYDAHLNSERSTAPSRIAALAKDPRIKVIAIDERMLQRSTELAAMDGIALESFDLAVLAAALVWAERMTAKGDRLSFCERDSDLWPWNRDKDRTRRHPLVDLYDAAGIWVYADFTMSLPPRPAQ